MAKYLVLKRLGLSKAAVTCYESLYEDGAASATQLAGRLALPRTGLYRVLRDLEAKGFVRSIKSTGQPVYFHAEHLETALKNLSAYQNRLALELINEQKESLAKQAAS